MKRKIRISCIFMLFILVSTILSVEAEGGQDQSQSEVITIDLGIYNSSGLISVLVYRTTFLEMGIFPYEWEVGNKRYYIDTFDLLDTHLQEKNNIPDKFDVILISGGGEEVLFSGMRGTRWLPRFKNAKDNVENFIKGGGGYVGHCGGAEWALEHDSISTRWEQIMTRNSFLREPADPDVKKIKIIHQCGLPFVSEWLHLNYLPLQQNFKRRPEYIGNMAYFFYMANTTQEVVGIPFHLEVRGKEHPFLKDYHGDTIFMRADGGIAFDVPDNNPDICDLVGYSFEEDPFENAATKISAWGFRPANLIFNRIKWLNFFKAIWDPENFGTFKQLFAAAFYWLYENKGWEYFPEIEVDTRLYEGSTFVAIDNYDGDKGRLILGGPSSNRYCI